MLSGVQCFHLTTETVETTPDFDVVFVHGARTSSADAAWKTDNGDVWPLWLQPYFPTARILLLGYPAPLLFSNRCSRVTITERARNLADYLPTIGIGNRPTIFVCHSLGGIIVKEIIRCCVGADLTNPGSAGCTPHIATNTIGTIFLATPHSGSNIAGWVEWIGSNLTSDFAINSDYIVSLRDWFTQYAARTGIFVSAYYETQPFRNVVFVCEDSADPCCSNCKPVPLDANYSNIARPISPSSDIFQRIRRDIDMSKQTVDVMTSKLSNLENILSLPALTNEMYFDVINFLKCTMSFDVTARYYN